MTNTVQYGVGFPAATLPLSGTETLSLVQGGVTVDATTQDIANLAGNRSVVNSVSSAAGVVTINYALGDYFTLTLTENVTSITFSNLPGAGVGITLYLLITQGASAYTVAWPASFNWGSGISAPVMPSGSGNKFTLIITSVDNGTVYDATGRTRA